MLKLLREGLKRRNQHKQQSNSAYAATVIIINDTWITQRSSQFNIDEKKSYELGREHEPMLDSNTQKGL